jgi:hypothetical protein
MSADGQRTDRDELELYAGKDPSPSSDLAEPDAGAVTNEALISKAGASFSLPWSPETD